MSLVEALLVVGMNNFLDIIDLFNISKACFFNKKLYFELMEMYNSHMEIMKKINIWHKKSKNDKQYFIMANWAVKYADIRILEISFSSITEHNITEHNIETIKLLYDKFEFNMYFNGLNKHVKYILGLKYENEKFSCNDDEFDINVVDEILDNFDTDKEVPNIFKIRFPIIDGIRHMEFVAGDGNIFIISAKKCMNNTKSFLKYLKEKLEMMKVPGRPDLIE